MADETLVMKVESVLMSSQGPIVLLAPEDGGEFSDRVLPIFIDQAQAVNIQLALEGQLAPRPMTHDLFSQVLNELGAIVERVVVEELAQSTFYASLYVQVEKGEKAQVRRFDARPSDCIALAVRSGAPVHATRKLLEQASIARTDVGLSPDDEPGDEGEGEVGGFGISR